jgi:hypothetical protein
MKYKVDIMSKPQGDVSAPPDTWLPVPPSLYHSHWRLLEENEKDKAIKPVICDGIHWLGQPFLTLASDQDSHSWHYTMTKTRRLK